MGWLARGKLEAVFTANDDSVRDEGAMYGLWRCLVAVVDELRVRCLWVCLKK
jgi:hypothetical protein